jgi:hypothetical protein
MSFRRTGGACKHAPYGGPFGRVLARSAGGSPC